MHQLLASDLLLRNGDPRVMKEVLENDVKGKTSLRSSVLVSIYKHILPSLSSRKLSPLSGKANLLVANALMQEGDTALLPQVFDDLYSTFVWNPAKAWDVFSIILYLTRMGQADEALVMLQRLVQDDHLPRNAIGRSNPTHPEAVTLLIQSIIVRSCLEFKLYDRAQDATEDLFGTLERSVLSSHTTELLYETCRSAIAGHRQDQIVWAGSLLIRFAHLPKAPTLPSSIINNYLDHVRGQRTLDFYDSLPESHQPPSPINIIRIAKYGSKPALYLRLLKDINRLEPTAFIGQRATFLHCLVKARLHEEVSALYDAWSRTFTLTSDLLLSIIVLLVRKVDGPAAKHRAFCEQVLNDFINRPATLASDDQVALASAYVHLGMTFDATKILQSLTEHDVDLQDYVDKLAESDPPHAYDFTYTAMNAGVPVNPPVKTIISACISGQWGLLSLASKRPPNDESSSSILSILSEIRAGRVTSAANGLNHMNQIGSPLPCGVYRALVTHAMLYRKWEMVLKVWNDIPQSAEESGELLDLGNVILSRLSSGITRDDNGVAEAVVSERFAEFKITMEKLVEQSVQGAELEQQGSQDTRPHANVEEGEPDLTLSSSIGSLQARVLEIERAAQRRLEEVEYQSMYV